MTDIRTLTTPFFPPINMIKDDLRNCKKTNYSFGIATLAIKTGKYRNNKLKQRMKLEATKNEFIDSKLTEWVYRINTIVKIKNKLIIDYFKSLLVVIVDPYESLMIELDKLLFSTDKSNNKSNNKSNRKNIIVRKSCDCRNIGFGFCFCRI